LISSWSFPRNAQKPKENHNYNNNNKKNNVKFEEEDGKKETSNINNSEVPLSKVQNNNFFKDLDSFEKSIVKNNELWNSDLKKEKNGRLENKKDDKNSDLSNDSSIKQPTENENKIVATTNRNINVKKINHNSKIHGNPLKIQKEEKLPNDMKELFEKTEKNENNLKIKDFKLGYCELIKGYICNFKPFKKNNNPIHKKYSEFSKYESNFSSLIDYSNLIKMMIKLRIMIDTLLKQERH